MFIYACVSYEVLCTVFWNGNAWKADLPFVKVYLTLALFWIHAKFAIITVRLVITRSWTKSKSVCHFRPYYSTWICYVLLASLLLVILSHAHDSEERSHNAVGVLHLKQKLGHLTRNRPIYCVWCYMTDEMAIIGEGHDFIFVDSNQRSEFV